MEAAEHERLFEHEEWYWWHRARERIVQRVLRRYLAPGGRLLDVGCGTGATTASLRALGSVVGMDAGRTALRHARERGLPVALASAEQLPVAPGRFDAAVALDVLEHLDDDVAAARAVRATLRPGGVLLVTVPAYPFLFGRHDVALGHRRRYRRRGLLDVLRAAGFEVELCSYAMASILPVALAVRLGQRLAARLRPAGRSQAPAESGYVGVPGPLNAVLTHLVGAEGFLLRFLRLPFGLSLIAVARRPERALPGSGARSG